MNIPTFQMPSIEEIAASSAAQIIRPSLTAQLPQIKAIAEAHCGEVFPLNRHNTRIRIDAFPTASVLADASAALVAAGFFVRQTFLGAVVTGVKSDW